MKPVGKPDAGNPHVRFDERGWETDDQQRLVRRTALILDSTRLSTAVPDPGMSTALRSVGLLDGLSSTPAAPSVARC